MKTSFFANPMHNSYTYCLSTISEYGPNLSVNIKTKISKPSKNVNKWTAEPNRIATELKVAETGSKVTNKGIKNIQFLVAKLWNLNALSNSSQSGDLF